MVKGSELNVLFGFFRTADLVQQYEVVSRAAWQLFISIDTNIFQCTTFGVVCLILFPIRCALVYPTSWGSLACEPAPQVCYWFFVTRVLFLVLCRLKALPPVFLGAPVFETRVRCPPTTPFLLLGNICDRPFHRTGVGSTAQGFSLTKLDTTATSISSSTPARPRPWIQV